MFSGQEMLPYLPGPSILLDPVWKPAVELPSNCPRCDSSNTKFCYYNNYSLSQPRYFCKCCRRYWTKGGSLRNVPVGGGCRKNRRTRSARLSAERVAAALSNYGCRQPNSNSVRPDLLLDDPAANSCHSNGIATVSSATESTPGGADIDLALLYTKFLNPRSELDAAFPDREVSAEANESLLDLAGVVDSAYPMATELEQHPGVSDFQMAPSDMIPETHLSNDFLPLTGHSNFYMDLTFDVAQMPPTTVGIAGADDTFWPNNCSTVPAGLAWQPAQSLGIETLEEEHLLPHPSPFMMSNLNAFSSSSCQAFP